MASLVHSAPHIRQHMLAEICCKHKKMKEIGIEIQMVIMKDGSQVVLKTVNQSDLGQNYANFPCVRKSTIPCSSQ
jgi:hypothetical protein